MSAAHNLPPAPGAGVVPLPAPRDPTKKEYSEGSMYEDMSKEDIEAWHRRYAEFKRWRQDIPNNRAGGVTVGVPPSLSLGVGSADWDWRESSECGTVPSTIVERERKRDGEWTGTGTGTGTGKVGPQAEVPASMPSLTKSKALTQIQAKPQTPQAQQARVSTQSHSTTVPSQPTTKTLSRPPLKQKTSIPQNLAHSHVRPTPPQPLKVPTIEIQPPSSKTQTQEKKLPIRQSSAATVRPSPSPVLAQAPKAATQVTKSVSRTKSRGELTTPSARSNGSAATSPGDLVVPSPTPSAKYAEREAYINSALSLPLDLLTEREDGYQSGQPPPPPGVDSSSQLTTSRLDSLLGRSRGDKLPQKGGSQRSASSTTLPSVRSDKLDEKRAQHRLDSVADGQARLTRSKTTTALPFKSNVGASHREHYYEASDHLPVPGPQTHRSRTPPNATIKQAADRSQPPSNIVSTRTATLIQASNRPLPPSTAQPRSSASTIKPNPGGQTRRNAASTRVTALASSQMGSAPSGPSEATVIRATREPLPLSVPSAMSHVEHIQVPVSVKTVLASSGQVTRAPPTDATITRAAQLPLPASSVNRTATQKSAKSARSAQPDHKEDLTLASPRHVPLPPTALSELTPSATPGPSSSKAAALTHRQQMPLPRPALTQQSSFDGLSRTLSRRTRDPSMPDLTARFEPEMYPLPPSGATIFSSPEAMLPETRIGDPEVAFSTVEYIPQSESKSGGPSIAPSTPAAPAQRSLRVPSAKLIASTIQDAPPVSVQAQDVPLPPSTLPPEAVQPSPLSDLSRAIPSAASLPAPGLGPGSVPPVPSKRASTAADRASHHSVPASLLPAQPPSEYDAHVHPHIHFSPGQVSASLRSDDEHVSFEVPSGTRGRLRVTLKWLRDGGRSERGTPTAGGRTLAVIEEDERAPPVPPKTSSLMSKVIGRSNRASSQAQLPRDVTRSKLSSGTTTDSNQDGRRSVAEASRQLEPHSQAEADHPIPSSERPVLDPPSSKRDDPKSPSSNDRFPPDQQAQQQHHPSGPAPAPFYNPYYSGATLPAYRPGPQIPQVYNMMSPPLGYPQPGPGAAVPHMGWNAYRPMVRPPEQQPSLVDPDSPARQSIDPPSDNGDDQPAPPLAPNMPYPYPSVPTGMMGMGGYGLNAGGQGQQPWYGQGQSPTRPNIWQRMFRRPSQDGGQQGPGPQDNATIRNWRKGVAPGRAPTLNPNSGPLNKAPPTVGPTLTVRAGGGGGGGPRPTMAPTHYPGQAQGMEYSPGPGTTLYDARYGGYVGDDRRRGRDRDKSPSVWEKFMVRRQIDEAIYGSPPRRRGGRDLPDPAPMPPRSDRVTDAGRRGVGGFFSPRSGDDRGRELFSVARYRSGRKEYDRQGLEIKRSSREATRGFESRDVARRREREERTARRRTEKEERRRQRAVRRDERARGVQLFQGQGGTSAYPHDHPGPDGTYPTTPTPVAGRAGNGGTMGLVLSRDALGRTDMRDRPVDLGGDRGGRLRTMVGDWVGALGVRRTRGQRDAESGLQTNGVEGPSQDQPLASALVTLQLYDS
ncbi:hypothetical protein I317_05391 [Kwoniella heveanensis CBS 569]|nr:hypothetical protein I317_05391 [Kwoniella heveanensis CBS 569]